MNRNRRNNRDSNNSWNVRVQKQPRGPRAPRHLKGKEIGMFYANRQRNKKEQKEKRATLISFGIPKNIEQRVLTNLQQIRNIAKRLNIHIPPLKLPSIDDVNNVHFTNVNTTIKKEMPSTDSQPVDIKTENNDEPNLNMSIGNINEADVFKKPEVIPKIDIKTEKDDEPNLNMSIDNINEADIFKKPEVIPKIDIKTENDDEPNLNMSIDNINEADVFKKPEVIPKIKKEQSPEPGTSSADFIPISRNSEEDNNWCVYNMNPTGTPNPVSLEYGTAERLLALRGSGDYKYGYHDIINGTFDEKLEECLSKGVSINSVNEDIEVINKELYEEYNTMLKNDTYTEMMKFREKLPAYKKRVEILSTLYNNQVVVISGETGCGKSTQVPQIILDNAMANSNGANVHIFVTQPRRIAASSLAMRVAEERGEKCGNSVGYAVRLERIDARSRGSMMFCTTGVLLTELEVNQGLTKFSHVILDEVHERDCHIDLSMAMLKKVLQKRKDLKLILMSATIDAEKLSEYFDGCPMLHIEGLAYPVKDVYLEDILLMTKYQLPPPKNSLNKNKPWKSTKKNMKKDQQTMLKEINHHAEISVWLDPLLRERPELRSIKDTLIDPRIEDIDIDLIVTLLINICQGQPGAILVFLPGIGDITKLMREMDRSQRFPPHRYDVYPLHSKLPSLEQRRIFEKPPPSKRKIIIATNIAETSITIDDIVYVVDCAKIKYSGLNVEQNLSTLNTEWVSQANLRQRRGRAGRCQPGICYHLLTTHRATVIPERLLPELQRSNLLEPVLALKKLRLGMAAEAMKFMPSPPAESTVQWAVKHLQQCGALNAEEKLTPLGWHLARLPVHPSAGKLLLFGALFGVLDRAASVAAVWGFKDPFQLVIGKEKEVDQTKRYFSLSEPSDHVAISECIIQWENCSRSNQSRFAYEHFLSNRTLELLSEMKVQLGDNLRQMGFLPSGNIQSAWENRNAHNLSLFKALVAASLYPNLATVRWSKTRNPLKTRMRVSIPNEDGGVAVHPSSVLSFPPGSGRAPPGNISDIVGANWLVYWLKQKTSAVYLIEVTLVHTLPLLFFGELKIKAKEEKDVASPDEEDMCLMSISNVNVRCKTSTAQLLFELRSLLDQVLASKVMVESDYVTTHNPFQESVLNAVTELITAEDERLEYYGDQDDDLSSDASEGGDCYY